MSNIGHSLGLVMLYIVMAGYVVLMLSLLVQILFRAAIERHRRRQFTERKFGRAQTLWRLDGKRGWATNTLRPRDPVINHPAPDGNSAGRLVGIAPIVKQAVALVSIIFALGLTWTVAAQQRKGHEITISALKQQLLELESKETGLRMRLEELDEQLKPESIERELAGIGSTHPEELRENRRRLLTIERNGLQKQLNLLEENRAGIEAAIATAATAASLEYAQPSPSTPVVTGTATPTTDMISLGDLRITEWPLQKRYVAVTMLVLLCSGFILLLIVYNKKLKQ